MSSTIVIAGVSVDIENPCAVLAELRKAQIIVATGGSVAMTRFGEDEVRFTAASTARLDRLIETYQRLCDRSCGRQRRYAASVAWD